MAGGAFVFIALCCGLAGGWIARVKGSSFFVWFLICLIPPFVGLLAVILYRFEDREPDAQCPRCGKRVKFYEAICTRCGTELNPGYTDQSAPPAERPV